MGKMAHILDAMQLLKKSWDELDARTIASCWKKAQLLDSARLEQFNYKYNKKESSTNDNEHANESVSADN